MSKKCPYCGSSKRIWHKGWRYNKSGKKQMRWCNACKRRFTFNDGFWKMKHKPKIITEACSSYKRRMSLKCIKDHLSEYRETDISRTTVLNWIRKYSKLLTKKTEMFTPKIKGPLHNDEFFVHVKKIKCKWVSNKKDFLSLQTDTQFVMGWGFDQRANPAE